MDLSCLIYHVWLSSIVECNLNIIPHKIYEFQDDEVLLLQLFTSAGVVTVLSDMMTGIL